MKNKVTIIDDTYRRNTCYVDRGTRHRIQDVVKVKVKFEGEHLERSVRRARRWIRSDRFRRDGAPRHIARAMAAFHKVDPKGFKEALDATVGGS